MTWFFVGLIDRVLCAETTYILGEGFKGRYHSWLAGFILSVHECLSFRQPHAKMLMLTLTLMLL